jgi:spore germination protein YaaH
MKTPILHLILPLLLPGMAGAAAFTETWAYLMKGEETYFPADAPFTDVACFSASFDGDGRITGGHGTPPSLPAGTGPVRCHLVVTLPWNTTLAHIYLNPELPFRRRMIDGIVERAVPFDGVQVDFESIRAEDGTNYLNFLAALKKALPADKIFSVAVMARWQEHKKKNPRDAFDYPFIGMIADRVVVMAYDEHYRSGPPGPIASLSWCRDIFRYAVETIPSEKLVMGIPLYGRAWQSPSFAKAYKHREIIEEVANRGIRPEQNPQEGGRYTFEEKVSVEVCYETLTSLDAKLELYSNPPARGVAFWRISQEPPGFWERLKKRR